jgi:hypothetical protein
VLLAPTRHHVVASDLDLRGKRFPLFSLTGTVGGGALEVTLDLQPVRRLSPTFARPPARAVDFVGDALAGAAGAWHRTGMSTTTVRPDPLFARFAVARCVARLGDAAVALRADAVGWWFYGGFRLWELNRDAAATTLLRALAADGRTLVALRIEGDAPKRLVADVAFGGAMRVVALGPVAAHWPDYDEAAWPWSTDLVPVLIHYGETGNFRIWVRDLRGPPLATGNCVEGAPAIECSTGVSPLALVRAGALDAVDDPPRTVDVIAPRLWTADPGVS